MSTVLDKAREAAGKAAAALQAAEAKHADAIAGAQQRNTERRTAHWQRVLDDTLPAAQQALQAARTAFTATVADAGDIAGAYVAYVKAHAAEQATRNAVCKALVTYVDEVSGKPNEPGDHRGRQVFPAGLRPSYHDAEPFVKLLAAATKDAAEAHARATVAELQAPLLASIEAEL